MKTDVKTALWAFSLATKLGGAFMQPNVVMAEAFLLFVALAWLSISLICWAHPGGPAWGKLCFPKRKPSSSNFNKPIPGPRGLPFFGSIKLMISQVAHRQIAAAAQSYDARQLMAFSLGHTRVVVTCDADVAKEILQSPMFVDRPAKESAHRLMFNRAIGFAPCNDYWRLMRRIAATHFFSPKQIKATEYQRRAIASGMVSFLGQRNHRQPFTVHQVLRRASLHHMTFLAFGRRYEPDHMNEEAEEVERLVNEGYELLGMLNWSDHFSWLSVFDPQNIRSRCCRLLPKVKVFVSRMIREHREKTGDGYCGDFVDVLLSLQDSEKLSDLDIIAVLWEMMFRGTDTVAVLIEWILARLVLHPEVQSKVQNELDEVVGCHNVVDEGHVARLVYLQAVVKEVLRLHPPGPLLSWARLAAADTLVNGHHVPAGTTAMVNMWAISRDPKVWKDPHRFMPERFVVGKEGGVEFSVFGADLRLAPFGSGKRSCPGKTMAMITVIHWVALLLHEYEWLPSPSNRSNGVDLTEVLRLSCEMAYPLTVTVRPRHGSS
ncbi:hypothetical protein BT93_F1639 [Corymbia citriodora subsp. variegata]|nr:hypothetical protein BT93_F1639 [Corymbia citriodora subsp. variegata]